MANNLTSSLIVRLIDQVTAPARSISRSILGIQDAMRPNAGAAGFSDRLTAAIEQNNAALDAARGRMFDAVAAGFALKAAFTAPVASAIEIEAALSAIGSKTGLSAEQLGAMGVAARQAGADANQTTTDMLAAVDYLTGMGMSAEDAMKAVGTIGMAATATKGQIGELSQAGYAAIANLKVPADQVGTALDAMAMAGKRGGFELKDMAQYMPQVGAAYQALGQSGTGSVADLAAAMQVMRADTGDASSAATNLQNVLQKIYAPATVKKFGEKGVDIFVEMEAAAKRGLTPIEAIAEIANKALDGDLSKIGFLFEDAQAQAGVRSMIQRMEEFRAIRAEAMAGAGTNEADFNRAMQTTEQRVKRARIAMQNMGTAIGSALLPVILELERILTPVLTAFTNWAGEHPQIVGAVVAVTASLIGLRVALSALSFVGLMGRGGALSLLAGGMNTVGAAASRLGGAARSAIALQTALGAMAGGQTLGILSKLGIGLKAAVMAVPGMGALGSALSAIGAAIATISAPVWGLFAAIAVAVAAAGVAIYKYWDRITATLSGVGQAIGEILAPAFEAIRPVLDWFAPLGDAIAAGWERAGEVIGRVGEWLGSIFAKEVLSEDQKAQAKQSGYDFVMNLWNGMKQVMADLLAWVGNKASEILAPFKAMGETIKSYLPGGTVTAADNPAGEFSGLAGANAKGGPMSPGRTYLVGEQGPELVTPTRSGYVHPNGSGGGGASIGGVTVNTSMHFNGVSAADAEELFQRFSRRLSQDLGNVLRGTMSDLPAS